MADPAMETMVQEVCRLNPVPEQEVREFLLAQLQGDFEREYPTSFRSRLDEGLPRDERPVYKRRRPSGEAVELQSRCHCGLCAFGVELVAGESMAIRCHCAACRRFHTSAYGAFVLVPDKGTEFWQCGGNALLYRERCSALGSVDRVMCQRCFAKLATLPLEGEQRQAGRALLALGAVTDSSVPPSLARRWQVDFQEFEVSSAALWWTATPNGGDSNNNNNTGGDGEARRSHLCQGGCSCGGCRFEAALLPGEAQHCYCQICRQLSGSVAQTWVPASNESFRWTKQDSLRLVRTTSHGQRHICTRCGGVLTIVYDAQPDCTWPVVGALDDSSLPVDSDGMWYGVIHICCSMMQTWHRLPDDNLPRLKFAG
ncbi:unnamed protein product [Polarella glacialis]|uniref:CENP-V/GFA domain-containing protein n=1 Tax=Polarella glacialis TaxID=89957 RepID=A0A813L8X0_POLGL|nr:unnamed protein product [Polarella glacialis]CAE8719298.1 unnamed protein product [Polarella glacialis]